MKEAKADLFRILGRVDWACIPTNGIVTALGQAVMGRGVAELIKTRWPHVQRVLGEEIRKNGNIPNFIGYVDRSLRYHYNWPLPPELNTKWTWLYSFPTKRHWRDPSSMELILHSAQLMMTEAANYDVEIAIPRPGCGNGGLEWEDVRTDLKKVLDDRFTIIHNG